MRFKNLLLCGVCAVPVLLGSVIPVRGQMTARWGHTTTLMANGNIIVVGGATDSAGTPTANTQIFIATDGLVGFQTADGLNVQRASHTATLLPNGKILVVGGKNTANGAPVNSAEIYDPEINLWSLVPGSMNTARMDHTATLMNNGEVLIAGGQTNVAGVMTNKCTIYDPAANVFRNPDPGDLNLARGLHTATLLHNGRVMVAGGMQDGTNFALSTEFFDPSANSGTGVWTPGPTLIIKRSYHTATQLGNTKVLIAGGYNGRNIEESLGLLDQTEIYDPVSNTITPGPAMVGRKIWHSSTLHPDGTLLIDGGFGNVTTSYAKIVTDFEPSGTVCLGTPTGGLFSVDREDIVASHSNNGHACTTNPTLDLTGFGLTPPVSGTIIDGEVKYSSGQAKLTTGHLVFTTSRTLSFLDFVSVLGGKFDEPPPLPFAVAEGTFTSLHRTLTATNADLKNVSSAIIDSGTPLAGQDTADITGGTLLFDLSFPVPLENKGGFLLTGDVRILSGSIVLPNDAEGGVRGFSISVGPQDSDDVTSNVATLSGATTCTTAATTKLTCTNVSFTSLFGSITNLSTETISTPIDLDAAGLSINNIAIEIRYMMDRLDVSGETFTTDISTIIVRSMGFSDHAGFTPKDGLWKFGAPMESAAFNHATVLMANGDHQKYGGRMCDSTANCGSFTYNPLANLQVHIPVPPTPTTKAKLGKTLPSARSKHSATLLPDGRLFIVGGVQGANPIKETALYNPNSNTWEASNPLQIARSLHSATLLPNGTVLAAGGFTSAAATGSTITAELWYPQTETWQLTSQMISSRTFHSAVLLPDGNLMVAGGLADGNFLSSAEVYYSTARVWSPLTSMGENRSQHTMTLLQNGTVLIAGGVNITGVLNTARIYDPVDHDWTLINPMNTGRHSHTATLLSDGRVLVAGGNDGFGQIGEAEIYNPKTGIWTATDPTNLGPSGGKDLLVPRLNHSTVLAPNGRVLFFGGIQADGESIHTNEGFDVAHTTFQVQGELNVGRTFHTSTVLLDGRILTVGGNDGISDLTSTEEFYFGIGTNDSQTTTGLASLREPEIISVDTGTFNRGISLTVRGKNLLGRTQAAGGQTSGSSYSHPRFYLERMDTFGNSGVASGGFTVDITTYIVGADVFLPHANLLQKWSAIDSSVTFNIPFDPGITPYGHYALRAANNAQFSEGFPVLISTPVPGGLTSVPQGSLLGVSSVTWSWQGVSSLHDGYNIYNATTSIFIATVPANAGTVTFIQKGLAPNNATLIKVAPYSLAGDGNVVSATTPVTTVIADVVGLVGTAKSTGSITWDWTINSAAASYDVYNASSGLLIANVANETFTQVGLATNTPNSVQVSARTDAGPGALTSAATVYTLAAVPLPGSPVFIENSITTGSWTAQWDENTNPDNTLYTFTHTNDLMEESTTTITDLSDSKFTLTGQKPNALFTVRVAAVNGDGKETAFLTLGSTPTLAAQPTGLTIIEQTPSSIKFNWNANGNPSTTTYQVVISTDNFLLNISTPHAFAAGLTQTTVTLSGLFTGFTYGIQVKAQNRLGRTTTVASTEAFTVNGGGPVGSLSVDVPTNQAVQLRGNLINGRVIELAIPQGTFPLSTRLFISVETPVAICGSINAAVSITALPAVQPIKPFYMSMSYTSGEVAAGLVGNLAIQRYDPAGGSCVTLLSSIDKTTQLVTSKVNHLSTFQLSSVKGASNLGEARIFPNPYYTRDFGYVTFDRLPADTLVRVYTLHGEMVFSEHTNQNGILTWDGVNTTGRPVASGIYYVIVEGLGKDKILKMAVIR